MNQARADNYKKFDAINSSKNPLVTFALFSYNQEKYIRKALEGALSQDYAPLEIIISDDCSSDNTYGTICDVVAQYEGPHKIIVNLNEKNLGLAKHVNKVVAMSAGDLIVVAAGDDISYSFRTSKLAEIFLNSDKEPLLIHSSALTISPEGNSLGVCNPPLNSILHEKVPVNALTMDSVYIGATGAWNRKLFDVFGPITYSPIYEDLILGSRAAMMGGLKYSPSILLEYRLGSGITTSEKKFHGVKAYMDWRKQWLEVMENVYLQRNDDSTKIGFSSGRTEMARKLNWFATKRRMYASINSLANEVRSNPMSCFYCMISEFSAFTVAMTKRLVFRTRISCN